MTVSTVSPMLAGIKLGDRGRNRQIAKLKIRQYKPLYGIQVTTWTGSTVCSLPGTDAIMAASMVPQSSLTSWNRRYVDDRATYDTYEALWYYSAKGETHPAAMQGMFSSSTDIGVERDCQSCVL